ncbi:hypothetical protein [Lederbergia lenta]|uniref:hypothetical protein n=1 Tax=Lederbergia lenta TaxID=1467 RepID=UPI00203A91F9|nr:hypothetical protein [Lederbergia lenta]MCM3109950.1 hypothetical protein [Lederbergia lenta]
MNDKQKLKLYKETIGRISFLKHQVIGDRSVFESEIDRLLNELNKKVKGGK